MSMLFGGLLPGLVSPFLPLASAGVVFEADLPANEPSSLAIYDHDGVMIRALWSGAEQTQTKQAVSWDLLDDSGQPVKPDKYEFRLASGGSVRPRYIATVANGRHPQIAGDLGNVEALNLFDVVVDRDGTIFSSGGGHGKAVQKISPDGRVGKAGTIVSAVEVVSALAFNDQYLFAIGDHGFYRINKETMNHAPFPGGELVVRFDEPPRFHPEGPAMWGAGDPWQAYEALRQEVADSRQTDGSSDPRTHAWRGVMRHPQLFYEGERVRGAAVWGNRLLLSDRHYDQILIYDIETGRRLRVWSGIYNPSGIVIHEAKEVYVISGRKVVALDVEGRILREIVVKNLTRPEGLAIGPDGNLYVTDLGIPNQVKVFSSTGKLLKRFGGAGPFNGKVRYDKLGIPHGIAVDGKGNILLAEFGLNRIQKLSPRFRPLWDLQAFYCYLGTNDQSDPRWIYGFEGPTFPTIREFRLDYKTGRWTLNRAWYLNKFDDASSIYGYLSQGGGVVTLNGKRFLYVYAKGMRIFRLEGDSLIPVVRFGPRTSFERKNGTRADYFRGTAPNFSIWHDWNHDQRVTEEEVSVLPDAEAESRGFDLVSWDANIADDGTVYFGNMAFSLVGVKEGIPQYSWDRVSCIALSDRSYGFIRGIGVDDQGNRYYGTGKVDSKGSFPGLSFWAKRIGEQHITKYSPRGKRLWQVGRKAYGRVQNGEFSYLTSVDWASGFVFAADMDGYVNVFTEDGLFLARMFKGTLEGADPSLDPYCITGHELGQARAYRNPRDGKTYLVSQSLESGEHIRVYSIEGLDQVKRSSGKFRVAEQDLVGVKPRSAGASQKRPVGHQLIAISSVLEPPIVDGSLDTWTRLVTPVSLRTPDGLLSVNIMLRYDEEYLYLGAQCIGDDTPAMNSYIPDRPADAWKSDCFNLFINTNPRADRSRTRFTAEDHQIFFPLNRDSVGKRLRPYSFRKRAWIEDAEYRITVDQGKGWTLTGRIPWSALGEYRPVPNDQIHLNFQVDFGNAEGTRPIFSLPWGGLEGSFANPSRWNGEGRVYYAR